MRYPERYRARYVPLESIEWDVTRDGRSWEGEEAWASFEAMPEKFEMVGGKLFDDDDDRMKTLGALLENMGIDRVIRLGDPALWRAAIAELPD